MRPAPFFSLPLSLVSELLDLIAPPRCAACDEPHPGHPAGCTPAVLCAACAATLEPPEPPPAGMRAVYAHAGPLARAVHRAKYGSTPWTARRLGALLARESLPAYDRVLPVPLHPRRLRARGFNQAVELCRALAAVTTPRVRIDLGSIVRVRNTPTQVGLDRAGRASNVRDAFAPSRPRARSLEGARVLLVDDVVTTGATMAGVARAVERAGGTVAGMLALARAPLAAEGHGAHL